MKNKNNKSPNTKLHAEVISRFKKYSRCSIALLILLAIIIVISAVVSASWGTYQQDVQSRGIQLIPYEIPDNLTMLNLTCDTQQGFQILTGNFHGTQTNKEFVTICDNEISMVDKDLNVLDTHALSGDIGNPYEYSDMDGDGVNEIIFVDTATDKFTIMKYDVATDDFSVHLTINLSSDDASVRCLPFAGQTRCFVNDGYILRAFDYYDSQISDDWLNIDLGGTILNKPIVFSDVDKDGDSDICTIVSSLNRIICIDESKQVSINITGAHAGSQTMKLVWHDNEWFMLMSYGWSVSSPSAHSYAGLVLIEMDSGDIELTFQESNSGYNVDGSGLVWMDDIDDDEDDEFCLMSLVHKYFTSHIVYYRVVCKENNLFETEDVNQMIGAWSASNVVLNNLGNIEYENYTGMQFITTDGIYGFNESLDVVQIETWNLGGHVTVDDVNGDGLSEIFLVDGSTVRFLGLSEGNVSHYPVIQDYEYYPESPVCGYDSEIRVEWENFTVYDADSDTMFKLTTYCKYPDTSTSTTWSFENVSNLGTVCYYDPNITESYTPRTYITDYAHENESVFDWNFIQTTFSVEDTCTYAPVITRAYAKPYVCGQGISDYTLDVSDADGDTLFATYTDCDNDGFWDTYSSFVEDDELGGYCYYDGVSRTQYFRVWVTDQDHFTTNITWDALNHLDSELFSVEIDAECTDENLMPYIESLTPSIESGTPICLDQDFYFDNFSVYDYENATSFVLHYECEEDARSKIHTGLTNENILAGTCSWDYTGDKKITIWISDDFHNDLDEYPYESLQSYSMEYTVLDAGLCVSNAKPTIDNWTFKPVEHICVNNTLMGYNFSVTDLDNDDLFQLYVDCDDGEGVTVYSYNSENSLTFICDYENAGVYNITAWITDIAHEEFDYTSFNNLTISYEVWDNASCVAEVYNTSNSTCEGHCLFRDYFPYDDPYFLHGWSILDSQYHYDYWSFPFVGEMYFSEQGRRYLRAYIENNDITAYPISTLSFKLDLYNDDEFSLKILDYYNDLDSPITELVWSDNNIQYQEQGKRFMFSASPYLCEACYAFNYEHEYKIQVYWNMESITNYDTNEEDYSLVIYIDEELIDIIPFAMDMETIAIKEGYTGSLNFEKGYDTKFSLDDIYYYRGTNPEFDNTELIIFTDQSVEFDRGFGGWDSEGNFNCELYPECCARIDGVVKVVKTFCPYKTIFAGVGGWVLTWIKTNPLLFILAIGCLIMGIPIWLKMRAK